MHSGSPLFVNAGSAPDDVLILSGDSTIAGNMGILDMVAALDWVRDNIAVFGGDPEQITIAGVGAGGVAVNIMLQSPLTKNKFKRAVSIDAHYFSPLVRECVLLKLYDTCIGSACSPTLIF